MNASSGPPVPLRRAYHCALPSTFLPTISADDGPGLPSGPGFPCERRTSSGLSKPYFAPVCASACAPLAPPSTMPPNERPTQRWTTLMAESLSNAPCVGSSRVQGSSVSFSPFVPRVITMDRSGSRCWIDSCPTSAVVSAGQMRASVQPMASGRALQVSSSATVCTAAPFPSPPSMRTNEVEYVPSAPPLPMPKDVRVAPPSPRTFTSVNPSGPAKPANFAGFEVETPFDRTEPRPFRKPSTFAVSAG